MFSLSILIPSHNGRRHLERCLPSVMRYAPAGAQVIVVDDGSTDGTLEWLRNSFPRVEVLRLEANVGYCRAVNAGLTRARGEVVELLNNDTEVTAGWAEACLPHFADPAVGSVAPLVLQMYRPDVIDSAGQEYHVCGWAVARGYGRQLHEDYLRPSDVFGASASSGFYRRSALEEVGGFLPEYDAYLEDTDLAFRLRWAGYRCVYEPASRVYHVGSGSYGASERVVRLLARNEEFNFWINLPPRQLALGLLPHLGFVAVRALRRALGGQLRPFLDGKRQALAQRRWIAVRRKLLHSRHTAHARSVSRSVSRRAGVLTDGWRWIARHQCA